jgi:hypothetical protein
MTRDRQPTAGRAEQAAQARQTGRGHQDPSDRKSVPPVGIGATLTAAARAGKQYWWRILVVAVTVSVIASLAEILVEEFVDRADLPLSVIADLSASALSLLGAVFLSGFLCRLLGGPSGHSETSIRKVMRVLPWRRLVGADLLVTLIVVIGVILLIVPGLVAATYLGIVGPVLEVENRTVRSALRRSVHLVRGHFWTVALLVTLPVVLASEIESAAPHLTDLTSAIEILAIKGIADGLADAAIGLIVVKLAARLMVIDREAAASAPDR